jgi:hypothetical protein
MHNQIESLRRNTVMPKSCFNCRNAVSYPEISQAPHKRSSPAIAHCTLGYQTVKEASSIAMTANFYQATPELCPYYDPMMIEACVNCGEEIGKPVWSWELWTMVSTTKPVCSEECKLELEKQLV